MSERFEEKLREALASHDKDGDGAAVAGLADELERDCGRGGVRR